jgi:hypothetical protein
MTRYPDGSNSRTAIVALSLLAALGSVVSAATPITLTPAFPQVAEGRDDPPARLAAGSAPPAGAPALQGAQAPQPEPTAPRVHVTSTAPATPTGILGSPVLDVAIGLVFVYFLLSIVCSAAKEGIETFLKRRAIDLEKGIRELLANPDLLETVYRHPMIDGLFKGTFEQAKQTRDLPSYIPARNFSTALIDVILRRPPAVAAAASGPVPPSGAQPTLTHDAKAFLAFSEAVHRLSDDLPLKRAMLALLEGSGGSFNGVRTAIEGWFNSSMDRVSGWYKRWSQKLIFALGFLLAAALNADTLYIGHRLVVDPTLRQAALAAAQAESQKLPEPSSPDVMKSFEATTKQMKQLGLPLGWEEEGEELCTRPIKWGRWLMKALGLLLTALAIALGAPFWFDVLNKLMVIRSTVKPKEKSPEEKSKD